MTTKRDLQFVTVEDYLLGEQDGQVRHEYVAGQVFAMTGGSVYHNRIAVSFLMELKAQLRGKLCDIFVSDIKVKTHEAFYYPDLMVVCDLADCDPYTKSNPILIVEVTSPTTRSTDEREKRLAYLSIPSLQEYVLAEQDRAEVRILRRTTGNTWAQEDCGADDLIRLESLDVVVSMQSIYEGVWRGGE